MSAQLELDLGAVYVVEVQERCVHGVSWRRWGEFATRDRAHAEAWRQALTHFHGQRAFRVTPHVANRRGRARPDQHVPVGTQEA